MESPYRSGPEAEIPREIPFDDLRGESQRLLQEATEGRGPLLLSERLPLVGDPRKWWALALGSAVLLALVLGSGFGEIEAGGRGVTQLETTLVAALLAGGVLGAGLGVRARRLRRRLPIDPGVYVLVREVVDARGATLRLLPTSRLERIERRGGDLVLSFPWGERVRLQAGGKSSGYLQGELRELGQALEEAEQAGHREGILGLDPLRHERERWATLAEASPSRTTEIRRSMSLVVPVLLLGSLGSWPLCLRVAEASDRWGIQQAAAQDHRALLVKYLQQAPPQKTTRRKAEDALFAMAAKAAFTGSWIEYLRVARSRRGEASERAWMLLQQEQDIDLQLDFLRFGEDPWRQQADEQLLLRAREHEHTWLLERYSEAGLRREEVLRVLLPRKRLATAFVQKKPAELRSLLRQPIDEAVKQESRDALVSMFTAARGRLQDLTQGRTLLARVLDEALLASQERGQLLVIDAQPQRVGAEATEARLELLVALRLAMEIYVDPALLAIQEPGADGAPAPQLVLDFQMTPLKAGARTEIQGALRVVDPALNQGKGASAQPVRFQAPALRSEGRTFRGAAQEAFVGALLGQGQIR
ncbi:MAG: hypothetical protein MUF64_25860 [Polyangiaceae bacterium]|jgi:hypothetical protein|nr:hypothetical protein [Polyangiaceae bacterium]